MKCYSYIVLFMLEVLLIKTVNSFWFGNGFDLGSYRSSMYRNPLRALSIFDDGLEYLSRDPYLFDNYYDDELYELLKEIKKKRKALKKASKKKSKKSKKKTSKSKIETTTNQPISNIVYYFPYATFHNSFNTHIAISENDERKSYDNESSEENAEEDDTAE